MVVDRREMMSGLAVLALLAPEWVSAQAPTASTPAGASPAGVDLGKSYVFRYAALPVRQNANGGTSRQVLAGTLPTGEFVEVHETTLPPGQMPHQPHRHSHSEFLLIREGTLDYQDEGTHLPVGPGDVVFTSHNRLHGLKNVGSAMANYFVVAVGVQPKET